MKTVSSFKITGWDAKPYGEEGEGPLLSEADVVKRYQGDLDGEGRVRLLMCRASADGPLENAGYIASEQVSGTLGGREGTFVLHHWGIAGAGAPPRTAGHVVPGSGTGELAGLSGTMEIHVDEDGKHTLALEYEIGHTPLERSTRRLDGIWMKRVIAVDWSGAKSGARLSQDLTELIEGKKLVARRNREDCRQLA